MGAYTRGTTAALVAHFYAQTGGPPVDPTAITLTVSLNSVNALGPVTYPGPIVRVGPGSFRYDWPIPAALAIAAYTATWTATIAGVIQTGTEQVLVADGGTVVAGTKQATWATPWDVAALTGLVVTQQAVLQANAVIELLAARVYTTASTRTGVRDTEWMRRAVAYQAAWLVDQPDAMQRMDLTHLGLGKGTSTPTVTGLVLAPLAKWALGRVSWLKSRSLHVRSPFLDGRILVSSPTAESNDALEAFAGFAGGSGSFGSDD